MVFGHIHRKINESSKSPRRFSSPIETPSRRLCSRSGDSQLISGYQQVARKIRTQKSGKYSLTEGGAGSRFHAPAGNPSVKAGVSPRSLKTERYANLR